jgi:hypothetical protein
MTSVPNHRLPLNGNNTFGTLLLALILIGTSSCELFKPISKPDPGRETPPETTEVEEGEELEPIQSRRVYDPTTGTYVYVENAPTDKMDTISWTVLPEERNPPIVEDGSSPYDPVVAPVDPEDNTFNVITQTGTTESGSRLLSAYNVDLALPFLTDRYLGSEDEVDENSLWALHFYSGAKMALAEMRGGPVGYNVQVQDTKANANRVNELVRSPGFRDAHLVIGPYLKQNVTAMAESARGMEKVLISPYSAATGVSTKNPNYVQVNPTLETHLRSLIKHAYNNQQADRIVLVVGTNPNQQTRLGYIQDEYKVLTGDAEVEPLEVLSLDINQQDQTNLDQYLAGRKTVFIVPIYEDESFVANFLRLLYNETRDDFGSNVAVYGLPQWIDFTRINFDYYEGTNVHVSSSVFINKLDPAVRDFRRSFYDEYGALPRDEAYVGYDLTRYFLRMAAEHGTRFQFALEENPEDLLHTSFRFEPVAVVPSDAPGNGFEQSTLDRFENKFVNILQFKDYAFRRVN